MGLTLRNITIGRKQEQNYLFHKFSCHIDNGCILGLLGASGCGKSTLLQYIAGFAQDDFSHDGDIILDNIHISHIPAWQRKITLLFQDDLLFPHLDIGGNLAIGLPKNTPKAVRLEKINWACQQAQLPNFLRRHPASLSGGQRQRISVMRALLSAPKAILLDEPFSKLDQKLKQEFRDFVAIQIQQANIPAILVSHDHDDMQICQDVISLS